MAFEMYELRTTTRGVNVSGLNISVIGEKTKSLYIVLGKEFMAEHELKIGDNVQMYFGTGEDKGKLLIVKAKTGIAITKYSKKSKEESPHGLLIRTLKAVPPIEDFSGNKLPRVEPHYTIDEDSGGILVTLPDGFFAA